MQVFPSEGSLPRLAGAVMCDQDEAWSQARCFPAAKMAQLCERRAESAEPPSAERREQVLAFARQAIAASLELADGMEAA